MDCAKGVDGGGVSKERGNGVRRRKTRKRVENKIYVSPLMSADPLMQPVSLGTGKI
jgi:hypothetical protein